VKTIGGGATIKVVMPVETRLFTSLYAFPAFTPRNSTSRHVPRFPRPQVNLDKKINQMAKKLPENGLLGLVGRDAINRVSTNQHYKNITLLQNSDYNIQIRLLFR
jgi:hypothetical protein